MRQAESISTSEALRRVYAEGGGTLGGGVRRLYRGLPFALLQTPLTRFGDTTAGSGLLLSRYHHRAFLVRRHRR